jgi:hypothetical protein
MTRRRAIAAAACAYWPLTARGQAGFDPTGVARVFADLARREYHDPERAERLAARIETKALEGLYAAATAARELAAALMRDAVETTQDRHFYVLAGAHHGAAGSIRPGRRAARPTAGALQSMRADAFGVGRVEMQGDVGVVAIRRFYSPFAEVRAAIGAAMAKVEGARALAFDLTANLGGDPAAVAYVASYLFARPPFVINRFVWRTSGVEEFRTTAELDGPAFPERSPVFVAVSRDTFSAGEEFAYDLKALGRAVIVGERTGGGANHAEMFPLGPDLVAFIPCARAENPVTGGNWEGTGVDPDLAASKADALSAAIAQAAR